MLHLPPLAQGRTILHLYAEETGWGEVTSLRSLAFRSARGDLYIQ